MICAAATLTSMLSKTRTARDSSPGVIGRTTTLARERCQDGIS
jgi:hypothetical protein